MGSKVLGSAEVTVRVYSGNVRIESEDREELKMRARMASS